MCNIITVRIIHSCDYFDALGPIWVCRYCFFVRHQELVVGDVSCVSTLLMLYHFLPQDLATKDGDGLIAAKREVVSRYYDQIDAMGGITREKDIVAFHGNSTYLPEIERVIRGVDLVEAFA